MRCALCPEYNSPVTLSLYMYMYKVIYDTCIGIYEVCYVDFYKGHCIWAYILLIKYYVTFNLCSEYIYSSTVPDAILHVNSTTFQREIFYFLLHYIYLAAS